MAKDAFGAKVKEKVNWPVTILLLIGLITIIFPLYMAVVIAFKDPSEMTNDIAGILSLPSTWSLDNFIEAIQVTDFFNSFLNSLIITVIAVVFSVLIHSIAAYAIGRNMDSKKLFKWSYYFIVAGMYVPFAILMMPLVKQTAILHLDNMVGVMILYIVFYMPMNMMLYTGYLRNIPIALEEAARVDGASDPARHHGRHRCQHAAARADELPDCLQHELQPRVCFVPAGDAPDDHLLCICSEADHQRCYQRRREVGYA